MHVSFRWLVQRPSQMRLSGQLSQQRQMSAQESPRLPVSTARNRSKNWSRCASCACQMTPQPPLQMPLPALHRALPQ